MQSTIDTQQKSHYLNSDVAYVFGNHLLDWLSNEIRNENENEKNATMHTM